MCVTCGCVGWIVGVLGGYQAWYLGCRGDVDQGTLPRHSNGYMRPCLIPSVSGDLVVREPMSDVCDVCDVCDVWVCWVDTRLSI